MPNNFNKLDKKKMFTPVKEINNDKDIQLIKIDKIYLNKFQPRFIVDDEHILGLENSIKKDGLLSPILLNKCNDDKYILIAGHSRFQAVKNLKEKTIKSIVVSTLQENDNALDEKLVSLSIVENLQRKNLDNIELSVSFKIALSSKIFKTQKDLASSLGLSVAFVNKIVKISNLDNRIIEDIKKNKSTNDINFLYSLQKEENLKKQYSYYCAFLNDELTKKEINELTKKNKSLDNKEVETKETEKEKEKSLGKSNNNEVEEVLLTNDNFLKLKVDISLLSDDVVVVLTDELNEIIKKFKEMK